MFKRILGIKNLTKLYLYMLLLKWFLEVWFVYILLSIILTYLPRLPCKITDDLYVMHRLKLLKTSMKKRKIEEYWNSDIKFDFGLIWRDKRCSKTDKWFTPINDTNQNVVFTCPCQPIMDLSWSLRPISLRLGKVSQPSNSSII